VLLNSKSNWTLIDKLFRIEKSTSYKATRTTSCNNSTVLSSCSSTLSWNCTTRTSQQNSLCPKSSRKCYYWECVPIFCSVSVTVHFNRDFHFNFEIVWSFSIVLWGFCTVNTVHDLIDFLVDSQVSKKCVLYQPKRVSPS
jgi:hypothetical protein